MKVLWFSRHQMSTEQLDALKSRLGEVELVQVDKTITNVSEISEEMKDCDVLAIVAPIGLQQQFLRVSNGRPVIVAVSERVFTKDENGNESKVDFRFVKWERLVKIDVIKEDF